MSDDTPKEPLISRRGFLIGTAAGLTLSSCKNVNNITVHEVQSPVSGMPTIISGPLNAQLQPFRLSRFVWRDRQGRERDSMMFPMGMVYGVLRAAGFETPEKIDLDVFLRFLRHPGSHTIIPVLNNANEIGMFSPEALAQEIERRLLRAGWRLSIEPAMPHTTPHDRLESLNDLLQNWRRANREARVMNDPDWSNTLSTFGNHFENSLLQNQFLLPGR